MVGWMSLESGREVWAGWIYKSVVLSGDMGIEAGEVGKLTQGEYVGWKEKKV